MNADPMLIYAFWQSPDDSYHTAETIASVTGLSLQTLANQRCKGNGIKFVKSHSSVYYRKEDVRTWFKSFGSPVSSTSALTVRDLPILVCAPQVE